METSPLEAMAWRALPRLTACDSTSFSAVDSEGVPRC